MQLSTMTFVVVFVFEDSLRLALKLYLLHRTNGTCHAYHHGDTKLGSTILCFPHTVLQNSSDIWALNTEA